MKKYKKPLIIGNKEEKGLFPVVAAVGSALSSVAGQAGMAAGVAAAFGSRKGGYYDLNKMVRLVKVDKI